MPIATKTLEAIEEALKKDQGAAYRGLLKELLPLSDDAYSTIQDDWRDHLGASIIGRECSREVWYSFRWTTLRRFDGRMLRLFNRGHLEEPRMIALLRMIGCSVWQLDSNGKQFRIHGHRGHFGGGTDGVAKEVPDIPGEPVLTEYKTHNDKSFAKLVADGVIKAKWEHFVQTQVYMGKLGLRYALYMATNKNDDSLYAEIISFDQSVYERYLERSKMIIESQVPPPKINNSPGWFGCRFCDQKAVCHQHAPMARNCRTCQFSEVRDDGAWACNHLGKMLSKEEQRAGCQGYTMNPVFHS